MNVDKINSTLKLIEKKFSAECYVKNPTAYFYDLDIIDNNINNLMHNAPKQLYLYYAMKANNHPDILKCISQNKNISGFEIASAGELNEAVNYIKPESIIFTGPGKTEYELEMAIKNHIKLINVESVIEAIRIDKIAKKLDIDCIDILIRINLNYIVEEAGEYMSGHSTKMGIDQDSYIESFKFINSLERINICGIHVFAASGVLDYKQLIKSNKYIFDFVKKVEKLTKEIKIIDLGGGLGIDYTDKETIFNVDAYLKDLEKLIREYNFSDKKIIMELGTYLVGNAGYYTSKIIDIKEIKGKKHIIIAGGVNHMGLPLEMRRKHPVRIINLNVTKLYSKQCSVNKDVVDISGPLCMVTDKLSWDQYIESADIGDIVLFLQSGAYCYGEGMKDFLSHFRPNIVIIRNGEEI